MARLNSFTSRSKLYKSLLTSILHCGCETWTHLANSEKKDPGFQNQVPEETSPYLLLGTQDQQLHAQQDQLPCESTGTSSSNCQEMETCMVQACHMPNSLSKMILQGTLEGGQCHGQQRRCWMDNIKKWTSLPMPELLSKASRRKRLEEDLC